MYLLLDKKIFTRGFGLHRCISSKGRVVISRFCCPFTARLKVETRCCHLARWVRRIYAHCFQQTDICFLGGQHTVHEFHLFHLVWMDWTSRLGNRRVLAPVSFHTVQGNEPELGNGVDILFFFFWFRLINKMCFFNNGVG